MRKHGRYCSVVLLFIVASFCYFAEIVMGMQGEGGIWHYLTELKAVF